MSRGRITWRMAIAAVVLGWVGLLLDRPVIIATDVVRVSAVFGSVLPMVAALAWGWRAGLLAATLGLGGLYGWLVWPENGWVNVFNSLMACVWFGAHGWAAERRELPGARWWHDAYAVESAYELTYAVYILTIFRWGFTLNPPFWSTAATREVSLAVAELIAIKSAINGFLVVLLADAAVRIGPLRRLLGLRVGPESRAVMDGGFGRSVHGA